MKKRGPVGPLPNRNTSLERILQPKLQLAHGDRCRKPIQLTSQAANSSKTLVSRGQRLARKWRARQDVAVGCSPIRTVQQIERFRTELKLMTFLVRHAEVLV